ncbi:hypothetical protein F5Y13DRAFT_108166 [Hypoxylon sp. FL1857]|nr:hypothetical protein F5Y13DRAFT_108166 [Hypoxylon sp. FL1857]
MAPLPDNPDGHYDAAVPLDGGLSPADLGGGSKHFSPTGLEIGIITGVVVLVVISVVGLFVWRSRKNSDDKIVDAASADTTAAKEGSDRSAGTRDVNEGASRPKNDPTGAVNNDLSSLKRQDVIDHFTHPYVNLRSQHAAVEEHEIANRA